MGQGKGGANLRQTLKESERMGCRVTTIRRTGELRISHPAIDRTVKLNGRRKDTPRALTCFLRRLAELKTPSGS
jgi:hypothetical protein